MKQKLVTLVKSYLVAYALTIPFSQPLQPGAYEERIDYIIACVYELLGNYNFSFVLIGILALFGFEWYHRSNAGTRMPEQIVSGFFSAALLLGNSFYALNSWDYCFGSVINLLKTILVFIGYYCLFSVVTGILCRWFETVKVKTQKTHFYSKNAFLKCFFILFTFYLAVLILCFPGNLCWDVIGQIEQVTVDGVGFSAHHPLAHTLMVGGLTKLGEVWFASKETGLFLYMILQNVMLVCALSATVAVLAKEGVNDRILTGLMVLYCISPIYTNLSSTAIKDIPFISFVIGYLICFVMVIKRPKLCMNIRFVTVFIMMQIGMSLMRNNGLGLLIVCGLAAIIFHWKKYTMKERPACILTFLVIGALSAKLIMVALAALLGAKEGGKAEMLSLPLQQTARYLTVYEEELSEEERTLLEGVFTDVSLVAAVYDPDIADPVKALFDNEAPFSDVAGYFKAWMIGLCKHPLVYTEAFFNHVYGWFTPAVSNAPRYEVQNYQGIRQGMLFPGAEKVAIFLYRFAERIPLLGLLQNVGFYVWGLILLSVWLLEHRKGKEFFMTLPLWISLLVCMISPCFFLHPRYALPIIMGLPFVWNYIFASEEGNRERN